MILLLIGVHSCYFNNIFYLLDAYWTLEMLSITGWRENVLFQNQLTLKIEIEYVLSYQSKVNVLHFIINHTSQIQNKIKHCLSM